MTEVLITANTSALNINLFLFSANHENDERLAAADPDTGQLEQSAPGNTITADTDTYVWRDACR